MKTLYNQGPVFQSNVSLMSYLVVEMLTVPVSIISNSQVFLLKNGGSFCKCKFFIAKIHFYSKNINIYAIFNDQSFNNMLNNNTVSFEQLGPGQYGPSIHVHNLFITQLLVSTVKTMLAKQPCCIQT